MYFSLEQKYILVLFQIRYVLNIILTHFNIHTIGTFCS